MLELYSKKRFVVIFKDCPFDGDWKNCYLKENEIKKLQKNISPELLASFGRQLTEPEDIPARLNGTVLN